MTTQGYNITNAHSGKWFLIFIENGKSLYTQVESILEAQTGRPNLYIQNAFTYSPPNPNSSTDLNINQANGTSHFTEPNMPNSLTLYANCINYKAVDSFAVFASAHSDTWKRSLFDLTPFKNATFYDGGSTFLLPCWVQLVNYYIDIGTLGDNTLTYSYPHNNKYQNDGWYMIGLDNDEGENPVHNLFSQSVYYNKSGGSGMVIHIVYKPNRSELMDATSFPANPDVYWDNISDDLIMNDVTHEVTKFENSVKNIYWVYI